MEWQTEKLAICARDADADDEEEEEEEETACL